jgi:hypothetical protein
MAFGLTPDQIRQIISGVSTAAGGAMWKNPSDSAMNYFDQAKNEIPSYTQPWVTAGQNALNQLPDIYKQLFQNPSGTFNDIAKSYKQAPSYQFQLQQGLQGANNAASAGGMAGSPQSQQYGAQLANNFANQDFYNWMKPNMDFYMKGLGGMENLSSQGKDAATSIAEQIASIIANQARAAYSGTQSQNQNNGDIMGGLISAGLSLFGL